MTLALSSARRLEKSRSRCSATSMIPTPVTVLSVQESAEQVQAFLDSPDIKERMKAAGVTRMGQMLIVEEMDSGTH